MFKRPKLPGSRETGSQKRLLARPSYGEHATERNRVNVGQTRGKALHEAGQILEIVTSYRALDPKFVAAAPGASPISGNVAKTRQRLYRSVERPLAPTDCIVNMAIATVHTDGDVGEQVRKYICHPAGEVPTARIEREFHAATLKEARCIKPVLPRKRLPSADDDQRKGAESQQLRGYARKFPSRQASYTPRAAFGGAERAAQWTLVSHVPMNERRGRASKGIHGLMGQSQRCVSELATLESRRAAR